MFHTRSPSEFLRVPMEHLAGRGVFWVLWLNLPQARVTRKAKRASGALLVPFFVNYEIVAPIFIIIDELVGGSVSY